MRRRGERRVSFAVEGRPFRGDPAAYSFVTPSSTASCGLAVEEQRLYLVFATRHPTQGGVALFDTCSGTRSFDPRAENGLEAFLDVPAEKVLPQLLAMSRGAPAVPGGSDGASLPVPGNPGADVVGLLELGSLFTGEAPAVVLHAEPSNEAPAVVTLRAAEEFLLREIGYEVPAAVVREVAEGTPAWFRVETAAGDSGWVRAPAEAFTPVAKLLPGRLAYLNGHWDGWVWPSPGAGHPFEAGVRREDGRQEYPVEILAAQEVGGTLWFEVKVLEGSPCDGSEPKTAAAGWISAYDPDGHLVAWFWSRGC